MADGDTTDYYAARAEQARCLADRAPSPVVREIHLDMAQRYAWLSDRARPARPVLMPVLMPMLAGADDGR